LEVNKKEFLPMQVINRPAEFRRPAMGTMGYFAKNMQPFIQMYLQNYLLNKMRQDERAYQKQQREAEWAHQEEVAGRRRAERLEEKGYEPIDPNVQPVESWGPDTVKAGDKYYTRPERPIPSLSKIPGTNAQFATWMQDGKMHSQIIRPEAAGEFAKKNAYYLNLLDKGLITGSEYKKGVGLYIEKDKVPMYLRGILGTRTVEVDPAQVADYEQLGFKRGKWTPAKEGKEPTPTNLNTLLKSGEGIIAKGMGMDVSIMEKYDLNRQSEYFSKTRLYHRILELKPDWQTEMGVRKAVDLATKITAIAINEQTGQILGRDKVTGQWIPIQ
jgi:hypothetical protein